MENSEYVTVIFIRGDPIPAWLTMLLDGFGKVSVFSNEIDAEDQHYTSTQILVTGKPLQGWIVRLIHGLGAVNIYAEVQDTLPQPKSKTNVGGQKPPLYAHSRGLFTPTLFLQLALMGYTLFVDNQVYFARISGVVIHIYSAKKKEYACLHVSHFMQFFQGSGKPSFGERIDQILESKHIDFITDPVQMEPRKAISMMKWDESYLFTGGA